MTRVTRPLPGVRRRKIRSAKVALRVKGLCRTGSNFDDLEIEYVVLGLLERPRPYYDPHRGLKGK